MDKEIYWLLTHFAEGRGKMKIRSVYDLYKLHTNTTIAQDNDSSKKHHNLRITLGRLIKCMFPGVRVSSTSVFVLHNETNTEKRTSAGIYHGLVQKVPPKFDVTFIEDSLGQNDWKPSLQNYGQYSKFGFKLIINEDYAYQLFHHDVLFSVARFGFPKEMSPTCVENLSAFLEKAKFCFGAPAEITHEDLVNSDARSVFSSGESRRIKHVRCQHILSPQSLTDHCPQCGTSVKHLRTNMKRKKKRVEDKQKRLCLEKEKIVMVKKVLSVVRDSMDFNPCIIDLLCDIEMNPVAPLRRRWDPEVIRFALNLWSTSPTTYHNVRKQLTLPSVRSLYTYKNIVEQKPGINPDMLDWMGQTADAKEVESSGRRGGLIFDEMTITPELQTDTTQTDTTSGKPLLVGAVDMGAKCKELDTIRNGKVTHPLASHVLQFLFSGHTGFTFPICHYPTIVAEAYHLYALFWPAVRSLLEYDFHVEYTLFDGAPNNRTFLKMMFHPHEPLSQNMTIPNLEKLGAVIVIGIDPKNVIKRLRNIVLSSGKGDKCTRILMLNGKEVVWDHWRRALNWDTAHGSELTRVHPKLTWMHIEVDGANKRHIDLAEECLNKDMYELMSRYRDSLKSGAHLEGTLTFLKHTQLLVSFVNDDRPITELDSPEGPQIKDLTKVQEFFEKWENHLENNQKKKSMLMPAKLREDVKYCCVSLREIIKNRINSGGSIVPSRINGDALESFFDQQRCIRNGVNKLCNYLRYCRRMNSIVLSDGGTQSTRKSKNRKPASDSGTPSDSGTSSDSDETSDAEESSDCGTSAVSKKSSDTGKSPDCEKSSDPEESSYSGTSSIMVAEVYPVDL